MTLATLWLQSPEQLQDRHVRQIIAFAGDGRMLDGSQTSGEFHEFLGQLPSKYLKKTLKNVSRIHFLIVG